MTFQSYFCVWGGGIFVELDEPGRISKSLQDAGASLSSCPLSSIVGLLLGSRLAKNLWQKTKIARKQIINFDGICQERLLFSGRLMFVDQKGNEKAFDLSSGRVAFFQAVFSCSWWKFRWSFWGGG